MPGLYTGTHIRQSLQCEETQLGAVPSPQLGLCLSNSAEALAAATILLIRRYATFGGSTEIGESYSRAITRSETRTMLAQYPWLFCLIAIGLSVESPHIAAAEPAAPHADTVSRGRELFSRVWKPNDARSPAGDGLGPVFNDASCAACHNLSGLGGAGPNEKNVRIITIAESTAPKKKAMIHAGFTAQKSVVLHRASVEKSYEVWRNRLLARANEDRKSATNTGEVPVEFSAAMKGYRKAFKRNVEAMEAIVAIPNAPKAAFDANPGEQPDSIWQTYAFGLTNDAPPAGTLSVSQRNSTALFGVGLIDQIPEAAIEAVADQQLTQTPRTAGQISKLADKRIGRFGWQAQQASLADFALSACAVELGLGVPGHPQAGNPLNPQYQPPGLDMTGQECESLVDYLAAFAAARGGSSGQGSNRRWAAIVQEYRVWRLSPSRLRGCQRVV